MQVAVLLGVDRPGLAPLLAERGLRVGEAAGAAVALVAIGLARPDCPTIVEVTTADQARGLLDDGAEDVVLRSDPDMLVAARLAALARRAAPGAARYGAIEIDTVERVAAVRGTPLPLLPREYALLLYMVRHGGALVDHATIHRALWGREFDPGTNVIAVHMSRLRGKLDGTGVTVVTERGRGYRLAPIAGGDGAG